MVQSGYNLNEFLVTAWETIHCEMQSMKLGRFIQNYHNEHIPKLNLECSLCMVILYELLNHVSHFAVYLVS